MAWKTVGQNDKAPTLRDTANRCLRMGIIVPAFAEKCGTLGRAVWRARRGRVRAALRVIIEVRI